ncbi:unnamed protein product, partial [Onchocerca flexuosa]|uniref:D-alanyl-D-alanine carboxypeptidase n=1 Tax=Onchocerca flexuosa TaxID=387005 RepID=A0A183I879_9BILA
TTPKQPVQPHTVSAPTQPSTTPKASKITAKLISLQRTQTDTKSSLNVDIDIKEKNKVQ